MSENTFCAIIICSFMALAAVGIICSAYVEGRQKPAAPAEVRK